MMILRKVHPLVKVVSGMLYDLPSPSSLSYFWNFGSLLSLCLVNQLITGVVLSMHYLNSVCDSFGSVIHIMKDVDLGFFFRVLHMNGAGFFFILVYLHIGRGLFYGSYKMSMVWLSGILILFLLMGTAFLGYVLPWGQMSFWGATVITNLISAVPYIGNSIVEWLWGGFSVGGATLSRFFSLHFLLPFVILAMIVVHLVFLHMFGSSNSLGGTSDFDKLGFGPYYIYKDIFGVFIFLTLFFFVSFIYSYDMGDPENFNPANPLSTPVHIQPEWYFLFAYAILRSIPSKLGGVLALVMSILIFSLHSFFTLELNLNKKFLLKKFLFWLFFGLFMLLTWIGAKPVEAPYESFGRLIGFGYFMCSFAMLV